MLSRAELTGVARGFADDPVPGQARVLAVTAGEMSAVTVDRDERRPTAGEGKPSDHAPLIVTLTADGR